jgi:hypothetical protein
MLQHLGYPKGDDSNEFPIFTSSNIVARFDVSRQFGRRFEIDFRYSANASAEQRWAR